MHFYEKLESGEIIPRHFVPMTTKDGLRPTRISDVKKAANEGKTWVPSVTTILDVLDKRALTNWKIDQHLSIAYKNPDLSTDNERGYIDEIKRLTELQMDKAPAAGSNFHTDMQNFITGNKISSPRFNLCKKVYRGISDKTGNEPVLMWLTEQNFISDMGYGGQIDLTLPDWVIDYKTKQKADKFKPGKMVYDEHWMQLAAYREAVKPKGRAANIFVCLKDGQVEFVEHTEEQLQRGWKMFHHAKELWYLQNGN